jgi:hypothetical protein
VAQAGWREQARARAAEHGFGKFEMADLMRRPERSSPELDLGVVVSRLSGSSGMTEMPNTFARRHALAEVAGAFLGGGTVAAVEAATDRYLVDPSVRELDAAVGHEARFTTGSLLMCERAIVDGADRRRNEQTATLPADAMARAIDRHQPVLNDGQVAAIRALTRAGHGVEVVSALAGTGKDSDDRRADPGLPGPGVSRDRDRAESPCRAGAAQCCRCAGGHDARPARRVRPDRSVQ